MPTIRHLAWLFLAAALWTAPASAQHSVARQWNEALLAAIRTDFARPTVHARNLFHTSIALYDAWAVYGDGPEQPYMLGKTVGGFTVPFTGVPVPEDITEARNRAMSYAAYRLLEHRFVNSPGLGPTLTRIDQLMDQLGYDPDFIGVDYAGGDPAALGNYIARQLIQFGLQDGSNEQVTYRNLFYTPLNPPLGPALPGNPDTIDPNFWQPLSLEEFIDQSGNAAPGEAPPFLSAEWGHVIPFAMDADDLILYQREDNDYPVYHDPGPPPHIDTQRPGAAARHRYRTGLELDSSQYQWGFALVSVWSAQLDPTDGVIWDISPASIGHIPEFPQTVAEYRQFYNLLEGGDASLGHALNPHTGEPYEPQLVPRADYARVLAEFWADGPDSETPPGHWFTILNYVNDHPLFEKRFKGEGPVLDDLEWDVKAYFVLSGAVHDAAVSAWGIKGWYDYVRPISAIRWMADMGQSSDPDLPRYHEAGIPLIEGYIEMVAEGDSLAGEDGEHIDKIKLKAWRGPTYITNPDTDMAGVGWILAENWWSYQRPTFVTPPFAGYISGHSTFSRAAAEVMTLLTGDPFFPGGLGEFHAPKNEFLVFEEGPSVDIVLQWATYRDASDQTSLSRIWGGIHPPADDIPGRLIGARIGHDAFALAEEYFGAPATAITEALVDAAPGQFELQQNWPNPFNSGTTIGFSLPDPVKMDLAIYNMAGQRVLTLAQGHKAAGQHRVLWDGRDQTGAELASGLYLYRLQAGTRLESRKLLLLR
ncbi:MAG: T9SS type A sorting domain-containing protein [Candidatus Latescibacteria bacterium]|nr:T9SS type A sorting domain-containing protein [Candidatus Latescibacterota bacterium]